MLNFFRNIDLTIRIQSDDLTLKLAFLAFCTTCLSIKLAILAILLGYKRMVLAKANPDLANAYQKF